MEIRFYIDASTGDPHLYSHDVNETEVEDVVARPLEDRPGRDGSRVAVRQTRAGRYLIFVITAYDLGPKAKLALRRRLRKKT